MDNEGIIDQAQKPDKLRKKEVLGKTHFPIYKLEAPKKPISDSVVREVERATLTTFQVLDEDTTKYQRGIRFEDLINVWAKNEQNQRTFPRKKNIDESMLVIVLSTLPVLDYKGREHNALETPNNVLFVNLRKIDDMFTKGSKEIPLETKAGIAIVEEVIHHIQHVHWGRERKDTIDLVGTDMHTQDEVEFEAAPLKKKVDQILYPTLDIKVKGVDF